MPQTVYFTVDTFTSELEREATNSEGEGAYNAITFKLPEYFTNARNPNKTVQVLLVRLYDLATQAKIEGSVHSNLVMSQQSADYYICATNLAYPNPKTYTISDNKAMFDVWFKRVNGSIVDLDPTKTRVIIELLLTF